MVVFVNGSFGVGKTTVARRLRSRLRRACLFDPEAVGYVLQRLPAWLPMSARRAADFQDAPSWRMLTARLAWALQWRCGVLIVPMTFANPAYLNEVRSCLERRGVRVGHFCLTAAASAILERLVRRGLDMQSPEARWILPRVRGCCNVHATAEFAEQVATDALSADAVATRLQSRIDALRRAERPSSTHTNMGG